MKAATFLLAGAALLLSACSSNSDDNEPPQQATAAHVQPRVVMSAMAEASCTNAGERWRFQINWTARASACVS